jgi:hypothetical protein
MKLSRSAELPISSTHLRTTSALNTMMVRQIAARASHGKAVAAHTTTHTETDQRIHTAATRRDATISSRLH